MMTGTNQPSQLKKRIPIWSTAIDSLKLPFKQPMLLLWIVLIMGTLGLSIDYMPYAIHGLISTTPASLNTENAQHTFGIIEVICQLAIALPLTIIFTTGIINVYRVLQRDGASDLNLLFAPFGRMFAIMGATIVLYGAAFLAFLPIGILGVILSGFILPIFIISVIPLAAAAIYIYLNFVACSFYSILLVVDSTLKPMAAIKKSRQKAWNHLFEIIVIPLLVGLIIVPFALLIYFILALASSGHSVSDMTIYPYYKEFFTLFPAVLFAVLYNEIFTK